MAVSTKNDVRATAFNLPNQLTAMRLVLSVVLFVLMIGSVSGQPCGVSRGGVDRLARWLPGPPLGW